MTTDIKDLLKASYKSQREAQDILGPKGYTYDPAISSMTDKVFLDKYGNPLVLHRGSKRVMEDWIGSNIPLAFGLEDYSARFNKSKNLISELKQKYPNKQITSAGHSLGASIAEKSGANKVITFNKGAGLGDIGRNIPSYQTDIRTRYDIPSALSQYQTGGTKIELPGTLNPYSTHIVSTGLPSGTLFV